MLLLKKTISSIIVVVLSIVFLESIVWGASVPENAVKLPTQIDELKVSDEPLTMTSRIYSPAGYSKRKNATPGDLYYQAYKLNNKYNAPYQLVSYEVYFNLDGIRHSSLLTADTTKYIGVEQLEDAIKVQQTQCDTLEKDKEVIKYWQQYFMEYIYRFSLNGTEYPIIQTKENTDFGVWQYIQQEKNSVSSSMVGKMLESDLDTGYILQPGESIEIDLVEYLQGDLMGNVFQEVEIGFYIELKWREVTESRSVPTSSSSPPPAPTSSVVIARFPGITTPAPTTPASSTVSGGIAESKTTQIANNETPATSVNGAAWSLLSLMLTIKSLLFAIVLILYVFIRKKQEQDEKTQAKQNENNSKNATSGEDITEPQKENTEQTKVEKPEEEKPEPKTNVGYIVAIVLSLLVLLSFILFNDMRDPMRFITKWTWLTLVISLLQDFVWLFNKLQPNEKNKKDKEDTKEQVEK